MKGAQAVLKLSSGALPDVKAPLDRVAMVMNAPVVDGVHSRMIMCDPTLAESLLELNTHNRPSSKQTVRKYATEIFDNEWKPTCAGIGIDTNFVLVDGQTRLSAIIETGIATPLLIVWGLPPSSQEKVDRQRRRSLFDVFHLADMQASRKAVQIATYLARFQDGTDRNSPPDCTVKQVLLDSVRGASINAIVHIAPSSQRGLSAVGVLAAIVLFHEVEPDRAVDFLMKLREPAGLEQGHPCYRMSRYLAERGAGGRRSTCPDRQEVIFRRTCCAINAFRSGQRLTAVREAEGISGIWPKKA